MCPNNALQTYQFQHQINPWLTLLICTCAVPWWYSTFYMEFLYFYPQSNTQILKFPPPRKDHSWASPLPSHCDIPGDQNCNNMCKLLPTWTTRANTQVCPVPIIRSPQITKDEIWYFIFLLNQTPFLVNENIVIRHENQ